LNERKLFTFVRRVRTSSTLRTLSDGRQRATRTAELEQLHPRRMGRRRWCRVLRVLDADRRHGGGSIRERRSEEDAGEREEENGEERGEKGESEATCGSSSKAQNDTRASSPKQHTAPRCAGQHEQPRRERHLPRSWREFSARRHLLRECVRRCELAQNEPALASAVEYG